MTSSFLSISDSSIALRCYHPTTFENEVSAAAAFETAQILVEDLTITPSDSGAFKIILGATMARCFLVLALDCGIRVSKTGDANALVDFRNPSLDTTRL